MSFLSLFVDMDKLDHVKYIFMRKSFSKYIFAFIMILSTNCSQQEKDKDQVLIDFLNLKFGMFIHYNMGTYHGEQWADPNHDPASFAPASLDCGQWARAAKSAKMNYAVLTAKHHDGFCLWDSKVTDYDVAGSSYQGDIVKEYTDAFRKEGIKVGIYYSIWDRHQDIQHGKITPEKIGFIKKQLQELLSGYGKIECLVFDAWGSKWGEGPDFVELPYDTLSNFIHKLQPDCLIINHSCRTDLTLTQVVHYEATHGQHCPFDNTIPSQQGPTLQPLWFWERSFAEGKLKPVDDVVKELHFANTHFCNYLLNAAPNDKGLMDDNVVQRLKEIGEAVKLSDPLTSLPDIKPVHYGVKATASSFNGKEFAPQNIIDANLFTRWQYQKGDTARWLELDFGEPRTFNRVICGEYQGGVRAFKIEALIDSRWKLLVKGKRITHNFNKSFEEVTAQKYRLTIEEDAHLPMIAEMTFVKY